MTMSLEAKLIDKQQLPSVLMIDMWVLRWAMFLFLLLFGHRFISLIISLIHDMVDQYALSTVKPYATLMGLVAT